MTRLLDLPDELLLQSLIYYFRNTQHHELDTEGHAPSLAHFILSRRLYDLAFQAFFEIYTATVTITQTHREWDQGTLLCDIYSPTLRIEGHGMNGWLLASNVQNLLISISATEHNGLATTTHEALREIRRYPRLRTIELRVWLAGCREFVEDLKELAEIRRELVLKNVKILYALDLEEP